VNPIQFDNLEDYVEFLDWQKSQGIRCPVLFLQHTFDAQGNSTYKIRPSVSEPQGGLPPAYTQSRPNPTLLVDAGRGDPPYNKNSIPAHDQSNMYIGATTPLDASATLIQGAGKLDEITTIDQIMEQSPIQNAESN